MGTIDKETLKPLIKEVIIEMLKNEEIKLYADIEVEHFGRDAVQVITVLDAENNFICEQRTDITGNLADFIDERTPND